MTDRRRTLGQIGEAIAAERLRGDGAMIVQSNVRTRFGEIDLIALHRGDLVFVEVKTLRVGAAGPERPVLSVGRAKRLRIRRLAAAWLGQSPRLPRYRHIRFDVIGLRLASNGEVTEYEHIRSAF